MKLLKFIIETCDDPPSEEYILRLDDCSGNAVNHCKKDRLDQGSFYFENVDSLAVTLGEKCTTHFKRKARKKNICMNSHYFGIFRKLLTTSDVYRNAVLDHLCENINDVSNNNVNTVIVRLRLTFPVKLPIDYKSNKIVEEQVVERRELEHAMSWLSTLGGAFSALGDGIQHCAVVAGKISIKQLQLAVRLGDPFTVIRCKLYCAISLLQLGKFSAAKKIIKTQYQLAKQGPVVDPRLISMCQGIWAKYKYDRWILKSQSYI